MKVTELEVQVLSLATERLVSVHNELRDLIEDLGNCEDLCPTFGSQVKRGIRDLLYSDLWTEHR